jgi:hypothetical protein
MKQLKFILLAVILTSCSDESKKDDSINTTTSTQTTVPSENSTPDKPQMTAPAETQVKKILPTTSYSILKEELRGNGKNTDEIIKMNENGKVNITVIYVQIPSKIEKSDLTSIASDIKNKRQEFERIYLRFYLPDQKPETNNPWATASYDPAFSVDILGSTASQDAATSKTNDISGKIIGNWRADESLQGAVLVLLKRDNKLFMKTTFTNGQSMEDEIATRNKGGKKIYDDGNSHGEYYIIESNGNLGMYGRDGKFDEAKKLN